MSSQLLCRIVFGSYSALFATWLGVGAFACWVNREIGHAFLFLLPAGLSAAAAIWIFLRWEDFGWSAGLIGLLFLLALVFKVGGQLRSSLRRYDKPNS